MKIISFAWTTAAFLAGRKTRTRRQWSDDYASLFKVGDIVQAYDRQPRFGGKKIGKIRITGIKKERIDLSPDLALDYEREGFKYMEENNIQIWGQDAHAAYWAWVGEKKTYWTVDFQKVG